jgi:co-chaperonin GroES (HSP10)
MKHYKENCKMKNQSGLHPVGRAILVRVYEAEKKEGLIKLPEFVKESSSVMEQRAEVIAIGARAWEDEGHPVLRLFGLKQHRAKPGDKVFVTKLAGFVTRGPADGQLYRLVNDRDIFCRITDERLKEEGAKL